MSSDFVPQQSQIVSPTNSALADDTQAGSADHPDANSWVPQVEARLGRPLLPQEREVLTAAAWPLAGNLHSLTEDRRAMPAVARELLDFFIAASWYRPPFAGPKKYHALLPPLTLSPARITASKVGAVLTGVIPLLCLLNACDLLHNVVWDTLRSSPIEASLGAVALGLATLFMPVVLWQQVDAVAVCSKLGKSDLLERLVDGDPTLSDIFDHTPLPWRWFALGGPSRNLLTRAKLVMNNLDWYLRPPRTNFRWHWLQIAVTLATIPAVLILEVAVRAVAFNDLLQVIDVLALLVALLVLTRQFGSTYPQRYFCQQLIYQLQERFGLTPAELAEEQRKVMELIKQRNSALRSGTDAAELP